ncbi:MAG: hypothetical protein PHD20_04780 [Clostridia bacterium]|nr:hypothetical protein [Clostridia bacterium]MDD4720690.1 hypothetical protein [Bacteroides sp.]
MNNKELIQSLYNAMTLEMERLEKRVEELEFENKQYREALGIIKNIQDLEERTPIKIKFEYQELSRHQHTIFEDWVEDSINDQVFKASGYKIFYPICIHKSGTTKAWTHESILEDSLIYQQSPDHFHAVLQIAAYLIKFGFTDVEIHHWNDVDVTGKFKNKTYAFEYERPGTHTVKELKIKFNNAKSKYDTVYIVCQALNKKEVARAIEPNAEAMFTDITHNMCTRGQQFKYFIERIISGYSIENCPFEDNL